MRIQHLSFRSHAASVLHRWLHIAFGQSLTTTMSLQIVNQKRKYWDTCTSMTVADVDEIRGVVLKKFQTPRRILIIGNGPVPSRAKAAVYAFVRSDAPLVIGINNFHDSAFGRVVPDIIALTDKTRNKVALLKWCKKNDVSIFVADSKQPLARERLWQPLAPLHCMRVADKQWERLRRTSSVTSGLAVLALVHVLWPSRVKHLAGFGGVGHAGNPSQVIWEAAVSEHVLLAQILSETPCVRHFHPHTLQTPKQPLALLKCQHCRSGRLVRCGHGRTKCKACGRSFKLAAARPRVPACRKCRGYNVICNGAVFWCKTCRLNFRANTLTYKTSQAQSR